MAENHGGWYNSSYDEDHPNGSVSLHYVFLAGTKGLSLMGSGWIGWICTSDDFLIFIFVFFMFFCWLEPRNAVTHSELAVHCHCGQGPEVTSWSRGMAQQNSNTKGGILDWIYCCQWWSTIPWSIWDGKTCCSQASMTLCTSPCPLAAAWDFKMIPGDLAKFVLQNMPHCFIFVLVFLGWFGGIRCIVSVDLWDSLKVLKVCGWNLSLVACANSTLWATLFGIEARSLGLCPLFWW